MFKYSIVININSLLLCKTYSNLKRYYVNYFPIFMTLNLKTKLQCYSYLVDEKWTSQFETWKVVVMNQFSSNNNKYKTKTQFTYYSTKWKVSPVV